jgi:hypothetical protein
VPGANVVRPAAAQVALYVVEAAARVVGVLPREVAELVGGADVVVRAIPEAGRRRLVVGAVVAVVLVRDPGGGVGDRLAGPPAAHGAGDATDDRADRPAE